MARLIAIAGLLALVTTSTAHASTDDSSSPDESAASVEAPLFGNVDQADCIIAKESHGLDVPNMQGSGAWGPGQYMPHTWVWHSGLYRAVTGYLGELSLHVLSDVRAVMSYVLTLPGMRRQWAVGGC